MGKYRFFDLKCGEPEKFMCYFVTVLYFLGIKSHLPEYELTVGFKPLGIAKVAKTHLSMTNVNF